EMMGHEVFVLTKKKTTNDGPLNFFRNKDDKHNIKKVELKAWPFMIKRPSSINSTNRIIMSKYIDYIRAFRFLFRSDFWLYPVIKKVDQLYKKFPFDIVISSYGPAGSHFIASKIKKKYNVYWVSDYRDLWYGYHGSKSKWFISKIIDIIERKTVSKADLITTVSKGLSNKMNERFDCEVFTAENGFDPDVFQNNNYKYFPDDNIFRIVSTGRICEEFHDLSSFCEAIKLLISENSSISERLKILFFSLDSSYINKMIKEHGLGNIISHAGYVSREDSIRIQRDSDGLLFFMWMDFKDEGILTGRLFEYLYSGKPILSIGLKNDNEVYDLIKGSGGLFLAGSTPEIIAENIIRLMSGDNLDSRVSNSFLKCYTRKALSEKLLDKIIINLSKKRKQLYGIKKNSLPDY
ncbi:MAG: glycosyltransferase, partial [Ignavibacterium sp.]|nr:glycosyltransferase [Ignavibacterium sp.]